MILTLCNCYVFLSFKSFLDSGIKVACSKLKFMLDLDRGSNVRQTQITISYRSNHSHPSSSRDDTDELGSKTF